MTNTPTKKHIQEYGIVEGGMKMNCGCNYNSCITNPFGCQGCGSCNSIAYAPYGGGFGCNSSGCSWFAIVLVVFLLLIICGNSRIRP